MTWAVTAAWTAVAVAAIGGAVSYDQGQRQVAATKQAAYNNAVLQNQQLEEQRLQIAKQAANDETERYRAQQIEEGRLRVITGESGALGLSADNLLEDSQFQLGTDIATIEANKVSSMKQTEFTGLSNYNQNTSAINQAVNRAPTLLGTGLQIAGTATSAYASSQAKTYKPTATKTA